MEFCVNLLRELRAKIFTSEKFYPPGRIFFMSGSTFGDDGEVSLREVIEVDKKFSDLVLDPFMFDLSRHVPNRYESALAKYWGECKNKLDSEKI